MMIGTVSVDVVRGISNPDRGVIEDQKTIWAQPFFIGFPERITTVRPCESATAVRMFRSSRVGTQFAARGADGRRTATASPTFGRSFTAARIDRRSLREAPILTIRTGLADATIIDSELDATFVTIVGALSEEIEGLGDGGGGVGV